MHAQQNETWYANFLPVARQLAEHGRTRLIERVNAYLDDTRAQVAIYKKMHEDACASDRTLHAIMAASNDDTHTRFGAMHDARQAVFDEANALWWKSFKS